jgi:hypothetical protein
MTSADHRPYLELSRSDMKTLSDLLIEFSVHLPSAVFRYNPHHIAEDARGAFRHVAIQKVS